jgi:hypothetical protein
MARTRMPPQFAEIIAETKYPFVRPLQTLSRPRTHSWAGRSSSSVMQWQASGRTLSRQRHRQLTMHCFSRASSLAKSRMVGTSKETMQFARLIQDRAVRMGTQSQFGKGVYHWRHILQIEISLPNLDKKKFIPSGRGPSDWIPGRIIVSNPADGFYC